MTTLFERLREDHDRQRELLARLEETSGNEPARTEVLRQLRRELEAHAAAEERCLYAPMMQEPAGNDSARHGVAEHHDIDTLIAAVEARDPSDPHWLPALKKLAHQVRHHLQDEEHGVFQLAGRLLSETRKQELGVAFAREKTRELERRGADTA